MEKLRAFVQFVKAGPFRGNHRKIQFDAHTLATTGNDSIRRIESAEDRADVLASARADREATIIYQTERATW